MNANRSRSLGRTAAVALAVLAAGWGARTLLAAEPAGAGPEIWRQDLLERVTLKAASATVDLKEIKSHDSRGRCQKPEIAKWIKPYSKTDANGNAEPVSIVGCRNGAFSGQVVVGSAAGIKVTATELRTEDGKAVIPASALQLRYGVLDGGVRGYFSRDSTWFEGLEEVAADGAVSPQSGTPCPVQPIWVTVRVPRDAAAGQYSGSLSVASGTVSAKVPVRLKVLDWTLPDAKDFTSHMGMIQSPDAVALKYKVPMWSEEHGKLMEKSFALLGQMGNDEVYITGINKTHLGNEHSMVRYVKQEDGSLKPDLSIAERYLDLALKHFGKPPVVCLYVWEYNTGYGWHAPENDPKFNKAQQEAPAITVVDPKTGALSDGKAPLWGTPESATFWRPVVEGLREALKKHGLEKSLMLGLAGDARPPRIAETDFRTIAPDVKWALHSHPYQEKLWAQPLGLGAFVWGARDLRPGYATDLQFGWKPKKSGMIFTNFPRGGLGNHSNPEHQRYFVEGCLAAGMDGVSRQGADFWMVDTGGKRPACVAGRYGILPGAVCLATCGNPCWLSAGKSGAIASASSEMIREGIQETEARIFIEKALADPALCAKLGGDLEKRCREALADRVNLILAIGQIYGIGCNENKVTVPDYVPLDWQAQSERLFAAAGEVAARLAK